MKRQKFQISYDREIKDHLAAIERESYSLIKSTIEQQLMHEPHVETRNRKPLKKPSVLGEAWELRFGPDNCFRVFYKFDMETFQVLILAIGIKEGNRLRVGGKEFQL